MPSSTSGNHSSRSGESRRESKLRGHSCAACSSATPALSIPRAELYRPARRAEDVRAAGGQRCARARQAALRCCDWAVDPRRGRWWIHSQREWSDRIRVAAGPAQRHHGNGACSERCTRCKRSVPEQSELTSICLSSAALQNITVTLSGPIPFAGAVLTSYQFTNRPGANLYLTTDVATAYNCSTQTGSLKSVAAGTPTVRANAATLRRHGSARARFARGQRAAEALRHGAPELREHVAAGLTRLRRRCRTPSRMPAPRSSRSPCRSRWQTMPNRRR